MSRSYSNAAPSPMAHPNAGQSSAYGQQFAPSRPSISPAPMVHQNSYSSHGSAAQSTMPQTPHYQPQGFGQHTAATSTPAMQNSNPLSNYDQYRMSTSSSRPVAQTSTSQSSQGNAYNPPRQTEVYTLLDQQNAAIPLDIRKQFQHDENGKVLFFTAPPLVTNPIPEQDPTFGHSLRYLADKARAMEAEGKKRKSPADEVTDEIHSAAGEKLRRLKASNPHALRNMMEEKKAKFLWDNREKIIMNWVEKFDEGTNDLYKHMFGEQWKEMREKKDQEIAVAQAKAFQDQKEIEDYRKEVAEHKKVPITGFRWI